MLALLDWAVLACLLLGPVALGTWRALASSSASSWTPCRRRRPPRTDSGGGHQDDDDVADNSEKSTAVAAEKGGSSPSSSVGVIAVGLSLLASNLSGITLLGYPAEVYRYGTQFWMVAFGAVLATALLCAAYLPVLHSLKLSSSYEYLELRFDSRVRKLTSIMYTVRLLLLLPLVIYVPALAFSQVTRVNIHAVAPAISLVCIIYTTVGGLSTVVLTGSLQLVVMVAATASLLTAGLVDVGGVAVAWRRMEASGRVEFFNLDPSPLTRTTFWSSSLGGCCFWLQMLAVQPNSVQRYLAVPTLAGARKTACLQCAGLVLTTSLACSLGAVLYAKYADCDPLASGEVQRADQLVALMVQDTSGRLPGLAGLFLAGLLSAAMGNLSAALNTLSHTLYADLVSGWLPARLTSRPATAGLVTKALGVLVGVWATLLVFVVEQLGGLVQVAMSLGSVTSGTVLGLFTLGMLVPRANTLGALAGASLSVLATALIVFCQQSAVASGALRWPAKPTSTDGCEAGTANDTANPVASAPSVDDVLPLLRLSYLWLVLLGAALTLLVGVTVSLLAASSPSSSATSSASSGGVDPALLWRRPRRLQQHQHETASMMAVEKEAAMTT